MKNIIRLSIIIVLFMAFMGLPGQVHAASPAESPDPGDKVIFGGNYTLETDETLTGSLIVFGGAVSLEQNSRVEGDIVLTGGSLDVSGTVEGSIVAIGGTVNINDPAVIEGDINTIGAVLKKSDEAKVEGNISNQAQGDFSMPIPPKMPVPSVPKVDLDPIGNVLWTIFKAIALAAVAALAVMFLSKPVERVAIAVTTQPVQTGLFGLLTAVVAPGLILILMITIILIPLGLIGALVLAAAVLFGWIAIGLEVGKKIATLFKSEWAQPVSAGIGTLVLTLIISAAQVIPCIGWLFPSVLGIFAVGAVLTTRFGTRLPTSWNNTTYIANEPVVNPVGTVTPSAGPIDVPSNIPPENPTNPS